MFDNTQNGLTFSEKISLLFIFCMAIFNAIRGAYWILNPESAINDSILYEKLNDIFPLFVWALPFLIGPILLIWSCALLIKQGRSYQFDFTFILGGFICAVSHSFIAAASVENGLNWITLGQNCILSIMFLGLFVLGVESLWKKRKI